MVKVDVKRQAPPPVPPPRIEEVIIHGTRLPTREKQYDRDPELRFVRNSRTRSGLLLRAVTQRGDSFDVGFDRNESLNVLSYLYELITGKELEFPEEDYE